MKKDFGRLQRAIIQLIKHSNPSEVGWTLSWLCDHVYGSAVSKSQRRIAVALIFDFLNGLHDAANSIATVVSTRVL